jgi:methylmalonyl-CoA/ethylmalonyl-CoA epimerase
MSLNLGQIGQIALAVRDTDRAERFYEEVLGLRKLYRFGDLVFFDCAGVRLLLEKAHDDEPTRGGCLYFRCPDLELAVAALEQRGVVFTSRPHLVARMADHDLRMAFFADPDGQTLALMQEAPKNYDAGARARDAHADPG